MNLATYTTRTLLVLALFFFTACSDSVDANEGAIDQAVSMEIFSQLNTQIMTIAFSTAATKTASTLDDIVIDRTVDCDGGGSVTVTGTITSQNFDENGTGTFGYDLRQKPSGCRITTSQGPFSVDGDPDIRVSAAVDYDEWVPQGVFEFGYKGGYKWSGPDGSGGCRIDLDYAFNYTTQKMSMKGRMCGYDFNI